MIPAFIFAWQAVVQVFFSSAPCCVLPARPRIARLLWALFCGLVFQIPDWSCGQEQHAFPVGQAPFPAELNDITADWQAVFSEGDGIRTLGVDELVYWGAYQDRAERHQILLRDGSLLVADVTSISDGALRMRSSIMRQQEIPLEAVLAINLLPKLDDAERFQQLRQLRDAAKRDAQVWLANGDRLRGVLTRLGNPAEAAADDNSQSTADVIAEGQPVSLPLASIVAARFAGSPGNERDSAVKALIGFVDGSLLYVTRIENSDGAIKFHTASGLALECTNGLSPPIAAVTFVQSRSPQVVYLSDLKPVRVSAVPLLDAKYELQVDRSAIGTALRWRENTFLKGLGMHSTSNAVYTIDEDHRRFAAEIAIDQSSGAGGSVVFRVFLLGADNQWLPSFTSEIIRGGQAPLPLSLELGQAKAIALAVEQSERGDILDRGNWLNARLEQGITTGKPE